MPKTQIKDEKTYRDLRKKGESKGKAARIANATAAGRKGGKSHSYDDWNKGDLVKRAKEVGIKGRSTMKKAELVKALRHH